MKKTHKFLFGSLLAMGMNSVFATGLPSCWTSLIDPLVGAWNGELSVPALSSNTYPSNFNFHVGGTLNGQGVQCIGTPIVSPTGTLFTLDTGLWKRTGNGTYKVMYSDVAAAPTLFTTQDVPPATFGVLPTSFMGRTGVFATATMSPDCQSLTVTGTIGLYTDTLLTNAIAGPLPASLTLYRVNLK